MPNLDILVEEVNGLNEDTSDVTSFKRAFRHIEEALTTTPESDKTRLRNVVTTFRNVLPDLDQLKKVKVSAKKLDEKLRLQNIADILKDIDARNQAIANLSAELDALSKKAKKDAEVLEKITDALDKADKTVT